MYIYIYICICIYIYVYIYIYGISRYITFIIVSSFSDTAMSQHTDHSPRTSAEVPTDQLRTGQPRVPQDSTEQLAASSNVQKSQTMMHK